MSANCSADEGAMTHCPTIVGRAAPLMQVNIDTDQIIPGEWLFRGHREGYAAGLFANQRYLPDGAPNPEFLLNRIPWRDATILIADRNFGCGSSREEAPVALREYGFRAVVAPSFGTIFFENALRNRLLPVTLPIDSVRVLADQVEGSDGQATVAVDLETQSVTAPDGRVFAFRVPARFRRMLSDGLDEITLTLTYQAQIAAYRAVDRERRPWAYSAPPESRSARRDSVGGGP
jgi:3-isopropylmalate/(R)-2-methylmalate dehydratase small subunit